MGKFGKGLLFLGKFTILPVILIVYKNILRFKKLFRKSSFKKINYIVFIKKYLPRLAVVVVLLTVVTNNLMASTYNTDEYANRTLLSTLVSSDEDEWSEVIQEVGPIAEPLQATNYVQEEGALQELAVATPFAEEDTDITEVADPASLVLINPEENAIEEEGTQVNRSEKVNYVVQPGDILGKIAEKFNVSINTILWENNLNWNSTIRPGDTLIILPNSGIEYEVASGDNISSIAKKYQADADKIIEANKLADASDIKIGDLLFIPDGIQPTRVVSSYTATPQYVPPAATVDSGTKLLWPVLSHRITQYYHLGHAAIDIGDKIGNPIYAAEAGKVERAGWSTGYGYNVIINHGNGIKTLYGHSSKLLVSVGDTVARGETIALVGSTGWSTGPHLHFEVRVNDIKQNPLNYIK